MEKTFIELYDPANAKNLTPKQVAAMSLFTDEQLKVLAEAFPNKATKTGYLLLNDSTAKKQLFQLSTWPNLYNLRAKQGLKKYSAFNFKVNAYAPGANAIASLKTAKAQDLTETELQNAAGIKKAEVVNLGAGETKVETAIPPIVETPAVNDGNNATGSENAAGEDFPDLTAEAAAMAGKTANATIGEAAKVETPNVGEAAKAKKVSK